MRLSVHKDHDGHGRRAVRRTVIVLVATAGLIYVAFIARAVVG